MRLACNWLNKMGARESLNREGKHLESQMEQSCLNCGQNLTGAFCAACGQEHTDTNLSIGYFLRQVFDEVSGYDSRLNRTLRSLLVAPGRMTRDYNDGARHRFVPPFRLYLLVSLLLFFTLNVVGFQVTSYDGDIAQIQSGYEQPEVPFSFYFDPDSDLSPIYSDKMRYLSNRMEEVNQRFVNAFSQAMFILLPFFALYLRLLLFDQKRSIVQHLIFSLHFHIFFFLACTLAVFGYVVLASENWAFFVILCYLGYLIISLRNAYTLSFVRTVLTAAGVAVLHFFSFVYVVEVVKAVVVMSM